MTEAKKKSLGSIIDEALKAHPWTDPEHLLDRENNFYEILLNQHSFYMEDPETFLRDHQEKLLFRITHEYAAQYDEEDKMLEAVDALHSLISRRKAKLNVKLAEREREEQVEQERIRAEKELSQESDAE